MGFSLGSLKAALHGKIAGADGFGFGVLAVAKDKPPLHGDVAHSRFCERKNCLRCQGLGIHAENGKIIQIDGQKVRRFTD